MKSLGQLFDIQRLNPVGHPRVFGGQGISQTQIDEQMRAFRAHWEENRDHVADALKDLCAEEEE